ncbi:hypothetical protein WT27_14420 [Burkholderia territorii]|uniref:Uncharacterized protein n=1 Tax=Burkholderia territorii TaxID=1503055 RepID=A0A119AND7_9BURK|nr:hypothetical protein WT27_14420 [Burkholderia territorii]KVX34369.1 hypothetical protein WT31_07980 [Burkholderia territorii]
MPFAVDAARGCFEMPICVRATGKSNARQESPYDRPAVSNAHTGDRHMPSPPAGLPAPMRMMKMRLPKSGYMT